MKLHSLLFILIIAVNLSNCSTQEKETHKDALMEAINRFNTAFREGNVAALESMITQNYSHTNGSSKSIRKKDWLNYLRKREKDIISGVLRILKYEMNEIDITFHHTSAIVTGKVFVSSKRQNKITENVYRVTHIWVYESGFWKRAGFHDGKIK